jgi:lysine-specific demethylase 3
LFPELYRALNESVPVPNLMRLNGSLNVVTHYPTNGIAPDTGKRTQLVDMAMFMVPLHPGPKMYLGQSSINGSSNLSSTRLHMDITDAYNQLLFAAKCPDGTPGYALWILIRPEDAFLVRKFLRDKCGFEGPEDPIHSQAVDLTPDLIERLYKDCGVRPFMVRQYPGDIVFIPAYCAHQVSIHLHPYLFATDTLRQVANYTDCIKVACDFVSVDNLRRTERLVSELRRQRLATAYGDDVLAFHLMLWYAWQALSLQLQTVPSTDLPLPAMDVDPSPTASTISAVLTPSLRKARRDRVYRKAQREKKELKKHHSGVFMFSCPHHLCGKKLSRPGFFDHV